MVTIKSVRTQIIIETTFFNQDISVSGMNSIIILIKFYNVFKLKLISVLRLKCNGQANDKSSARILETITQKFKYSHILSKPRVPGYSILDNGITTHL